jgi:hypothetical protein
MQTHKRGDTWSTVGQATIKDLTTGELVDLTDWQIASELRKPDGTLIAAFACTYTGTTTDPETEVETQTFTHIATDTSSWPVGMAEIDVQFTSPSGQVVSTDTQVIKVVRDVTEATP